MNAPDDNDSIRALVAPLRTPPVSEEARDRALVLALAVLPEGMRGSRGAPAPSWRRWVAVAGALGLMPLAAWWLRPSPGPIDAPRDNPGLMLAEVEKLFPQQLDSVVVDGSDVRVNVSPDAAPAPMPGDQRIRLLLQRNGRSLGVLTYSGRCVCVELDGRDVCLTPLLRGDGSVFVFTQDQVILDESTALPTGHRVHMERLKGVDS